MKSRFRRRATVLTRATLADAPAHSRETLDFGACGCVGWSLQVLWALGFAGLGFLLASTVSSASRKFARMSETPAASATAIALPPISPLALHARRVTGSVVGRQIELGAIGQELASARSGRLTALT